MGIVRGPMEPSDCETEDDGHRAKWVFVYQPLLTARECFKCGAVFNSYPIVYWTGQASSVFLHPECASYLGMHLIKDALLAQGKGGQ